MANCARGMLDSMRKTALQADPSTRGLGWARATSKKPKRSLELDPPAPLNHCKPVREKETAFLPNGVSGTKKLSRSQIEFSGPLRIMWQRSAADSVEVILVVDAWGAVADTVANQVPY